MEEQRDNRRSQALEMVREARPRTQVEGRPFTTPGRLVLVTDGLGQTAPVCAEAAGWSVSHGKRGVWLESLALNPLVYLLDHPYGKPAYKSQLVFREAQKFSLVLLQGV